MALLPPTDPGGGGSRRGAGDAARGDDGARGGAPSLLPDLAEEREAGGGYGMEAVATAAGSGARRTRWARRSSLLPIGRRNEGEADGGDNDAARSLLLLLRATRGAPP